MQRVKIVSEIGIEDTIMRTYIIYDDIKSKCVFDICACVPTNYQLVMLDGGESL